ncbi:MAG TPA: hypothetical protein VL424_20885 [Pararobbsia sp.]|nr:hypothetical protein [Pararobbsia sp.]
MRHVRARRRLSQASLPMCVRSSIERAAEIFEPTATSEDVVAFLTLPLYEEFDEAELDAA